MGVYIHVEVFVCTCGCTIQVGVDVYIDEWVCTRVSGCVHV